ncbi:tyrosine-type recombinase/integrase [Niallia sp. JL1B1071]|uniref:tyrosine-type recombinase/integrase n=1 Tax=Niallia tiangongensis TaxID=3237105 RepID=UPI0037DDB49B
MAVINRKKKVKLEKTVEELFKDFQMDNRIKNLSEMTIRFYDQNVIHFMRFLDDEGIHLVKLIEKDDIDEFILFLKQKDLKATTINTYLRATRALLYYAMREQHLNKFEINLIKADKQQKEPYTEVEIKKLIKKPNLKECGFVEHRNWVLINYLLETGNRLNTILNIKVADIDLENGMVVLTTTKNRKTQFNPISEHLVKTIKFGTYSLGGGLDEGESVVANLQSIAWGILSEGGLQIDIDKSGEAFQRGQIKIRARINSDFALTNPKLISHIRPTTTV